MELSKQNSPSTPLVKKFYNWWMNCCIRFREEEGPYLWEKKGLIQCKNCKSIYPLNHYPPRSLSPCERCHHTLFIPEKLGDFWLLEPLGAGGMGCVYKAYHPDYPTQYFAIKTLPPNHRNPKMAQQLLHEIQVLKLLGFHPGMITLISAQEDPQNPYLVTDYIEGERLDVRIQRLGRIEEIEVLAIALEILSVLAFIYECGFLYRDLKPQNIIITSTHPKLIDFGICRQLKDLNQSKLGKTTKEGTVLYYPPERVAGTGEGPWSEIYSLGMVMYHCLTGAPYVIAKDVETMTELSLRRIRNLRSSEGLRHVKEDVREVLEKMIARRVEDRYQHFLEVEHALTKLFNARF